MRADAMRADTQSTNLSCDTCGDRYYSATPSAYTGTRCLRKGCHGLLMRVPRAAPKPPPPTSV